MLSADGAMVPLVGGDWAEVKTLVIAAVKADEDGEPCREELSYCSRLTDAESFESETLVETHRRGLEHAEEVGAVMDGAEWRPRGQDGTQLWHLSPMLAGDFSPWMSSWGSTAAI